MNKTIAIGIKILVYSLRTFVALFLVGVVWAWAVVFLAEVCDNKFGTWGTFRIYIIISLVLASIEAGIFMIMQIIWALFNREFHAKWATRSALLLFVMTAGLPMLMPASEGITLAFVLFCPIVTSAVMIIPKIKRK